MVGSILPEIIGVGETVSKAFISPVIGQSLPGVRVDWSQVTAYGCHLNIANTENYIVIYTITTKDSISIHSIECLW